MFIINYALLKNNVSKPNDVPVIGVSDVFDVDENIAVLILDKSTSYNPPGLVISCSGDIPDLTTDFFLPDVPAEILEKIGLFGLIVNDLATGAEMVIPASACLMHAAHPLHSNVQNQAQTREGRF